jgi:hypothetical protein
LATTLQFQLAHVSYKENIMKEIKLNELSLVMGAGTCYGIDILAGDNKVCIGVYVS